MVTEVGATARWEKLATEGEAVAIVTPWWSRAPIERDGARIARESLPAITVRIAIEGGRAREEGLRREVERHVMEHESWAQVTGKTPVASLWQGIGWD